MAYERDAGGGGSYYSNPVNVENYYGNSGGSSSNDDGWFYPEGDDAKSFYQSLIDNPVNYYGSTPVEIEAEPIDNDQPQYDYSGYVAPEPTTTDTEDYSFSSEKQEAQKPIEAPEPEQPVLEVTTVEEPKQGYTWTETQPVRQPEQASVDSGFVTRMQNSTGLNDDETEFYSGSGNPLRQQEETPARSFADRIMSFGTTPAYGEAAGPVAQAPTLPLNNMQAIQYGVNQAIGLANAYNQAFGGQLAAPAPTPTPQPAAVNPLTAAGAPDLFNGGSYLPGTPARATMVPTRPQEQTITYNNPFSFGFQSPVSVPYPEMPQPAERRMTLTERPMAVQPQSPFNTVTQDQTPAFGLPQMQPRDFGYRNVPTVSAPGMTQNLPEAGVEQVQSPANRGTIMSQDSVDDYFRQSLANNPFQQTPAFQENTYEYDLRYGDPRNIPPAQMADTVYKMTGDVELANTLRQEYDRLKGYGLTDRQISADLARMATRNNESLGSMEQQDTLRSLMNPDGSLNYDYSAAQKGWLPDDVAVPNVDEVGRYNQALQYILTPIPEYNADGSIRTDKDGNPIVHYPFNSPVDILHMWEKVIPDGSQPTVYTQNGEGFRGIPESVLNDPELSKFLATSPYNSVLQTGISGQFEKIKATEAEFEQAVDKFIIRMPALQQLINNGVLTKQDVARFFFKGLDPVKEEKKESTKRYGGGGGGRSSSSTPRKFSTGGGGRSTSSTPVNPPVANQKMSRIFNIMKNWSF